MSDARPAPPRTPSDAAGEADPKGRAKPDRAINQDLLEEGLPAEYQTEKPGRGGRKPPEDQSQG